MCVCACYLNLRTHQQVTTKFGTEIYDWSAMDFDAYWLSKISMKHHSGSTNFWGGNETSVTSLRHVRMCGTGFWQISLKQIPCSRSQRPRGLRRRSAAARLLGLWARIPSGAWMFVRCECCVLSGRGFCDELITRPEEPYRLWCVVLCDLETSWMRRPWPPGGLSCQKKTQKKFLWSVS